jgi:hypothetical protein
MNSQIIQTYLTMPEVRLLRLINSERKDLIDWEVNFVNNWIKNKGCKCCENQRIQNKQIALRCNHIKEEIEKKKNKEKEKKLNIKLDILIYRDWIYSKRIKDSQDII